MSVQELRDCFGKVVPNDHSRQVVPENYIDHLLEEDSNIHRVMDLGCGAGESLGMFRKKNPDIKWIGLDIVSSQAVDLQATTDAEVHIYDGIHMPFADNYFDLIYSHQVFEHVLHPRDVLEEVYRVLRPGGHFIGSTSQLEPYHERSVWNYTPYGFSLLLQEAGLELIELRPSIDALALIIRRGLRRHRFFNLFWARESPLNVIINVAGKIMRKDKSSINLLKLLFCGQFCFLALKPEITSPNGVS